jgi:hypothetical protein
MEANVVADNPEGPMPLLDHFHPPLAPHRAWESFHSRWANSIADALHQVLPERFFAEVQIHLGSQVETDVAEFEKISGQETESGNGPAGGLALRTWAPPAATLVLPALFPDDMEVHVRDERDDARLVAVVELVSPRNKDRPESRRAFAAKGVAYLQRGIGLMILDTVTSRQANMHNEMVHLMGLGGSLLLPPDVVLYAISYRPLHQQETNQIDTWPAKLTVGEPLPVLPLCLRGSGAVPLDLEATYTDARQRSRLG